MNSTADTVNYFEDSNVSSQNVFGIGAVKYKFEENDPFCKFFQLGVC